MSSAPRTAAAPPLDHRRRDGPAERLARMLAPRSIAVVGASANPAKRGHRAVAALLDGFPGAIHPVNPAGGTILGLPASRGLTELAATLPATDPVDLVLVATPAATVPAVLAEAAEAGAAGAVVLAVGFAESGPDGARLQDEIRAVARRTGLRVIGPNTSGLLDLPAGINLVGVRDVPPGPIALLTQSGNMLLSLIAELRAADLPGLSGYVGLGNQVDVGYHELLAALARRPGTRALAVHCEGIPDGRAFLRAAATVTPDRPVVLLKGGNSDAGRRAAASHTGALAAPGPLARGVLTQAGVEVVDRADELAVVAGVLATAPVPAGTRVAVLADGGGHGTLTADALTAQGVTLARPSENTRDRLRALLGPPATVTNPVDVAGATDTDPGLFADCAELLLADPGVDLLLVVGLFGGYHLRFGEHLRTAERAAATRLAALRDAPILVQTCYATDPTARAADAPLTVLRTAGLPVLSSLDHAARCCRALIRRGEFLRTASRRSTFPTPQTPDASTDPLRPSTRPAPLTEDHGRRLLAAAGIDTGPWRTVHTPEAATAAVTALGGDCALKILSPQIPHKTEAHGVRLSVTPATAAADYRSLHQAVTAAAPTATITGTLVTPMAPPGAELLVGATQDPTFGPVLAVGLGGTLVELLHQVEFRAAPLTHLEATELLATAPLATLLAGHRNTPPADPEALATFLVHVSTLLTTHPDITELDLNPVLVNGTTITPLDVRVVLAADTGNPVATPPDGSLQL